MFSLQTIFGSGKQFYDLLDDAAAAWFKKQKAINWFNLSQFNNIETLVHTILDKAG